MLNTRALNIRTVLLLLCSVQSRVTHCNLSKGRTWVGSIHELGRVGSGRAGSNCVGVYGSPWMIQNVTLNVKFCKVYILANG